MQDGYHKIVDNVGIFRFYVVSGKYAGRRGYVEVEQEGIDDRLAGRYHCDDLWVEMEVGWDELHDEPITHPWQDKISVHDLIFPESFLNMDIPKTIPIRFNKVEV